MSESVEVPSKAPAARHSHRAVCDIGQSQASMGQECALLPVQRSLWGWFTDPAVDGKTLTEAADVDEP
jgi:hypothetical protein